MRRKFADVTALRLRHAIDKVIDALLAARHGVRHADEGRVLQRARSTRGWLGEVCGGWIGPIGCAGP